MLGSHFNFSTHTRARIRIGRINKQATGHGAATGLGEPRATSSVVFHLFFNFDFHSATRSLFLQIDTLTHTHTASLLVCPDCRCCCCVYLAVKLRQLHQCCSHAGSVKIYSVQRKGKSSQMENYGCTRAAYTHIRTHTRTPTLAALTPNPYSVPASFVRSFVVISGCFIQFRRKRNSQKTL